MVCFAAASNRSVMSVNPLQQNSRTEQPIPVTILLFKLLSWNAGNMSASPKQGEACELAGVSHRHMWQARPLSACTDAHEHQHINSYLTDGNSIALINGDMHTYKVQESIAATYVLL